MELKKMKDLSIMEQANLVAGSDEKKNCNCGCKCTTFDNAVSKGNADHASKSK